MTYQESFRSSDKGNYGHSWTNDRNSFPLFEEITKTHRNKINQTSESKCNFEQMKFKRSRGNGNLVVLQIYDAY